MKSLRKKGMEVVSWILLLGFAVALATTIALWQVKQTEKLSEGMVRFVSGELYCENVQFNIQAKEGCSSLIVSNSGYHNIEQFAIRIFSNLGEGLVIDKTPVPVKESKALSIGLINAKKAEIIPVIKISDELIGCTDHAKEVICKGLSEIQRFTCEQAEIEGECGMLEELGIITCEECCTEDYCCSECPT